MDDQRIAKLLTQMALVDEPTLDQILTDARLQDRSLRDMLLDGGYLTPFQMELIEAGRLEALMLGPVRVVDKLRETSLESVYRVFDPRRGEEVLLRQLHPESPEQLKAEYRESFLRASRVRHPQLAAVFEVLEMEGSPAALQEWGNGVPSDEWEECASIQAVWLRLLAQAATGLQAIHDAGLVHGHLQAGRILCTEDGQLMICGLGEPAWLSLNQKDALQASSSQAALSYADDLQQLGEIAARWLAASVQSKLKRRLSKPIEGILERLLASDPAAGYSSTKGLVQHIAAIRATAPDDAIAWERFLSFLRDRLLPSEEQPEAQRESA